MAARWGEVLFFIMWAHVHVKCRFARETLCMIEVTSFYHLISFINLQTSCCPIPSRLPSAILYLPFLKPGKQPCQALCPAASFPFRAAFLAFPWRNVDALLISWDLLISPVKGFVCYSLRDILEVPNSAATRTSSNFLAFLLHFLFLSKYTMMTLDLGTVSKEAGRGKLWFFFHFLPSQQTNWGGIDYRGSEVHQDQKGYL